MRKICLALLLLACCLQTGCIERSYTIRTHPADALVMIDGEPAGIAPITRKYMHYGTRQIILSKEGYLRSRINQPMDPPWFETFPIDFIVEMVYPVMVIDHRDFTYTLNPITAFDKDALLKGADLLKARTTDIEDAR